MQPIPLKKIERKTTIYIYAKKGLNPSWHSLKYYESTPVNRSLHQSSTITNLFYQLYLHNLETKPWCAAVHILDVMVGGPRPMGWDFGRGNGIDRSWWGLSTGMILEPQGQPFINGCFNRMIPNLDIGNGCFTKQPFINVKKVLFSKGGIRQIKWNRPVSWKGQFFLWQFFHVKRLWRCVAYYFCWISWCSSKKPCNWQYLEVDGIDKNQQHTHFWISVYFMLTHQICHK